MTDEESQGQSDDLRKWQEVAVQAQALGAGTQAGKLLIDALTPPQARVRWEHVLRGAAARAQAYHGRDEQTWARRARRQPVGLILPGWQATRAQIAVAIDLSGSMSEDMVARCVAETVKIGQLAGIAVYLVTHDVQVQWQGWLNITKPDKLKAALRGRGGTDFNPAYRAVEVAPRGRFDVLIHLTDGECWGNWPTPPVNTRKFVAALVGKNTRPTARPAGSLTLQVEI